MSASPLTLRRLEPALLPDFLAFFDGDAFADNPKWRSCYCQYLHVDHRQLRWAERTERLNRDAACTRIPAGQMQGWLAYHEGRVVGWCSAAPRPLYEALADEPDPDAARIGTIGCFVVAQPRRRRGVARALLDAACAGFRDQGLAWAEAMPHENAQGDAQNHHGPLALYLGAGFQVHRRDADGRVIVRRPLV